MLKPSQETREQTLTRTINRLAASSSPEHAETTKQAQAILQAQLDELHKSPRERFANFQQSHREKYLEYLKSPEWQEKRRTCLDYYGGRCAICYSDQKVQVHHRTYSRIFYELQTDLIALCENCHQRHHKVMEKYFGIDEDGNEI